jgi:hypothetical protein
LPHGNAVFQKKATDLIDNSCPITDQARTHAVQRLQIQLVVSLNRHTARRRALHGFRNRMGVSEIVLVALPKRLGIGRRHLFDRVAERKQLAGHVVRGHASFDPDEAGRNVHKSCSNSAPGDLFA